MIIFRSKDRSYPDIPTWVMRKDKLKDEDGVIVENGVGDKINFARKKLCYFLENNMFCVKKSDTGLEFVPTTDVIRIYNGVEEI